ncbi:MAG: GTP pyrophosphokinase family protein [Clostridia bacterium]|nr:GTP pyrophosphokinase family protein [Clostridia bacterium]
MEDPGQKALATLRNAVAERITRGKIVDKLAEFSYPYRELMTFYRCAIMEVETKFRVLNEEFTLGDDCNPIATIKTRLKSPESILEKLQRRGAPFSVESIEENINDIAGVRVICSFQSDIYMLVDALLRQDDVTLLEMKDYIKNPKPNGYRSLHLIISTPIFLHNEKRQMKVEVQLRTLAMDMWASLEHQIRYKKENESITESIDDQLLACAELSAEVDRRMQRVHDETM